MGTPLFKKLGIKEGFRVYVYRAPFEYASLFDNVDFYIHQGNESPNQVYDVFHLFVRDIDELEACLYESIQHAENSIIWVSWQKQQKGIKPVINREDIRNYILKNSQWVDTKVCSVNQEWSGLKFLKRRSK